jgi:hypothetical protein
MFQLQILLGTFNGSSAELPGVVVSQVNGEICSQARNIGGSPCGGTTTLPTGIDLFASFPFNDYFTPGTYFDGMGDELVVTSVPEPSTWAMMLIGLAGLGYMGFRQRRRMIAA